MTTQKAQKGFYGSLSSLLLVDLCHPLLVGVLSDKEEEDVEGPGESHRRRRSEVFLRIKQGLVLEVDMQRGRERCRLELCSLARVESTEAAWTRGVRGHGGGGGVGERDGGKHC